MTRIYIYCLILLVGYTQTVAQTPKKETVQDLVDAFVSDSDLQSTSIGVSLVDVQTKKELGQYRAKKALHTASLLKLITTATVLSQKSETWHYQTKVGYQGVLKDNTLEGDIVIVGSGDPTIHSQYFPKRDALKDIVNLLKHKNIRVVTGGILLDNSLFEVATPPIWLWEDIANYYGTSVSPLNYMDNSYTLSMQTMAVGTVAQIQNCSPPQALSFASQVVASKENRDNAYIFGSSLSNKRLIKGTLPAFRKVFNIKGAMPNPAKTLGKMLKQRLLQSGVQVNGQVLVRKKALQQVVQLGVIRSPSLAEIVQQTNRKSINLYAEALLFLIENTTSPKKRILQIEALKKYWQMQGIDTQHLHFLDGSGLSPFNSVSSHFFTQLLCKMSRNKAFKNSLSIAGVNGTLKYFGRDIAWKNKLCGKSGTMRQVCGYAGYLKKQSGREIAFAIVLNNSDLPNTKLRDKIANFLLKIIEN